MREETFKTTTSRGREMEVTVGIKNEYGWFELYDEETGGEYIYAEGGLWFAEHEGEMCLTDYDGVFELPDYVMNKLAEWGYNVDWI